MSSHRNKKIMTDNKIEKDEKFKHPHIYWFIWHDLYESQLKRPYATKHLFWERLF